MTYDSVKPGMAIRTKDNLFLVVETNFAVRNIVTQSVTLYDTKYKRLVYPALLEWKRDNNLWTNVPIVEIIPAEQVTLQLAEREKTELLDYTKGKNFEMKNQLSLWQDLYNPALGKEHVFRIYRPFDLLVDGDTEQSPEDFWIVMPDLDGKTFAQPISGHMLADKLMTGGYLPLNQVIVEAEGK